MKVYIAASSDDIARAEHWTTTLRDYGIDVVSTWPAAVRAIGVANPTDATDAQRRSWSGGCLLEVAACDVLWLLAPDNGHGRGAYAEFGAAHAMGKVLIASGDVTQSVFCAQATEFVLDGQAAGRIVDMAEQPHHRHLKEMRQ